MLNCMNLLIRKRSTFRNMSTVTKPSSSDANSNNRRPRNRRNRDVPRKGFGENISDTGRSRPTHFLCLPLGHHPDLQDKMTRFQSSLLEDSVDGLDPSILIKPRRLHFTLGVMSLSPRSSISSQSTTTVESALTLLRSLQPQLTELCAVGKSGTLQASLERLGAFESTDGARVMWVSPRENEGWPESEEELEERVKLVRVADMVHQAFKDAGYITETRPLKLHCTLINTSYRKPFSRKPQLFSFTDVLASNTLSELRPNGYSTQATSVSSPSESSPDRTTRVALGTYTIPEIQLCAMGSHGPEDEYVSLGSVKFNGGE
ncbi:AKAP7 2'5' RNA ligase-like domain-containing protein [Lentinula edodes]|nr:AKAP7 2'5' RNA ligase-like domain-containing protein [Lentinula edodes]